MSQLLIVTTRSVEAKRAMAAQTLTRELTRRLEVGCQQAERWSGADSLIMRLHGGRDGSGQGHAIEASFEHMQKQFRLLTDVQLDLEDGSLTLTGGPAMWRTIWVYRDSSLAIATTSLRLGAFFLRGFELDDDAPTQFLVTGSLGPELSWERRLRQLAPTERLKVDWRHGDLSPRPPESAPALQPSSIKVTDGTARTELGLRITAALQTKLADTSGWVLPLSGGYDSRGILMMLPERLPTITWGSPSSLKDPRSDSSIAAKLADKAGVSNRFIEVTQVDLPPQEVVSAFVRASEGRVDCIDAYADGLKSWKSLALDGITGVIRGDQAFGAFQRGTEIGLRRSMDALTSSDLIQTGLVTQISNKDRLWQLPRADGTSLATWRDDLYREFRTPAFLAPLNQVKASFVDIICPLLDPSVVTFAASLNDDQRTDKRIFTELVKSISPNVPFALRAAVPFGSFVRRADLQAELRQRLKERPPAMFDPALVASLVAAPTRDQPRNGPGTSAMTLARRAIRSAAPEQLVRRIARRRLEGPVGLDGDLLRLRMTLADEAVQMLQAWAEAGQRYFQSTPPAESLRQAGIAPTAAKLDQFHVEPGDRKNPLHD